MNSRKGGGKPLAAGTTYSSPQERSVSEGPSSGVEQLSRDVAEMNLDSTQDDGWEVYGKKSKNKAGSNAARSYVPPNPNTKSRGPGTSWPAPNTGRGNTRTTPTTGRGNTRPTPTTGSGNTRPTLTNRGYAHNYSAPPAVIPPPLEHGWKWPARSASTQSVEDGSTKKENVSNRYPLGVEASNVAEIYDNEDDADEVDDSDNELMSDDYDSDESQKSHETLKKNKWFKALFEILDALTVDQINEPERQWHCPACQNGPGAIDWYRGLQPLVTHAKTKESRRVKLHRELAELLEEELRRRGTSAIPAGEAFGKWKGLSEKAVKDKDIVWPPMVVIMNTHLDKDDNDKWLGMGNQELLEYFSSYRAVKARHSYGPQGHRGMSLLIFEPSAVGYLEAERLGKHFEDQRTDRDAWDRHRVPFYPGGQRQLYGYMAEKEDLDSFNRHCQGKSKLRYEMRSYQEMVVSQMKQMSEDNQQLIWYKNRVAKEQLHSQALEESFGLVTEKLRKTLEENRIVKQRTKMHHEQNKEEMDFQEQFYKDQIQNIHNASCAKEDNFEKLQQEQREKVKQTYQRRADKVAKFIQIQEKEMDEFVEERERLIKIHGEQKVVMKRRHWQEEVELEGEFDNQLSHLMEKYTPHRLEEGNGSAL